MPMFEFVCASCHAKFEELVRGENLPACPQCGSAAVERQLSVPSPQKTGAFPFKPRAVRPMGQGMPCAGGACGAGGGCGGMEGGSDGCPCAQ